MRASAALANPNSIDGKVLNQSQVNQSQVNQSQVNQSQVNQSQVNQSQTGRRYQDTNRPSAKAIEPTLKQWSDHLWDDQGSGNSYRY
ncbi:hypothetical protein NHX12_010492 [Muraenolepis orangiensis]|uniref:Uncharacterized protein n=1 Tax=Muraenolepis orangiensis TaxID=630683 RepID=A0A9Q0DJP5_9TELE|nr:hypothetical protein NHX12_010492 [Muraenolepis orangiensis]